MKILIAGASGFIGKELCKALMPSHQLIVLGRSLSHLEQTFPQEIHKITWDDLDTYKTDSLDVVINLSGSNIGAKRWTPDIKKELIDSRTVTNQKLIQWLIRHQMTPHYYCANAVGYYGGHQDGSFLFNETFIKENTFPQDFLQEITIAWEESLQAAVDAGLDVTVLRFGVVLKKHEGMLKKLELPFQLGLGSTLGEGNQFISWIHYKDLIRAILFLMAHPEVTGAINITSPHPITQKEFANTFAKILKRPLFFKMPPFLIHLLFGEMGDYLLLKGQRVYPKRLDELSFQFHYPYLLEALKQEYVN